MSSSFSLEEELKEMSEKLSDQAEILREAANVLKLNRENSEYKNEIDSMKKRVQQWLNR